jgi:signal transduction histidine kinase
LVIVGIWATLRLEPVLPLPIAVGAGTLAAGTATLLLHRLIARHLGKADEAWLAGLRDGLMLLGEAKKPESQLVREFRQLLCERFSASDAHLIFNPAEDRKPNPARPNPPPVPSPYSPLVTLGWATPESLQRRGGPPSHAQLEVYLEAHRIGVVVAIPRGSPQPSLILALGRKTNDWPYAFNEVQRLQYAAELLDSILARSRLAAQAELQARMEHMAMMSRGLAHDLKNLITPVDSFLVHTAEKFPPGSVELEVHATAKQSIAIMSEYLREALFFSEQLAPKYARTTADRLLESVREVTRERAARRNVRLAFDPGPLPALRVDAVLIQRLLGNLVANAVDASQPGQEVRLDVSIPREGAVRFAVSDRGCGIPAPDLERVFDAYFTTKEFGNETRGIGLGLTIAQKITHLHHGRIRIDSTPAVGTTVVVDLPAEPPVDPGAEAAPAPATAGTTA